MIKIDSREILTAREAKEKYEKYYIGFVITEVNMQNPDFMKGYVAYLFNSYDEGMKFAAEKREYIKLCITRGYAVCLNEPFEIGGIEIKCTR